MCIADLPVPSCEMLLMFQNLIELKIVGFFFLTRLHNMSQSFTILDEALAILEEVLHLTFTHFRQSFGFSQDFLNFVILIKFSILRRELKVTNSYKSRISFSFCAASVAFVLALAGSSS